MGGGLGNQMMNYTTYIAARKANPDSVFYLEMLPYFISEFDEVCCQWNGYELERIFGIKEPNILDKFSEDEQTQIIEDLRQTEFWKNNSGTVSIAETLKKHGINIMYADVPIEHSSMKQLLIRKLKEYIGAPSNLRLEHCIKNSIKRFVASRRSDKEDYFGYKKRNGNYYYAGCNFEFMKSRFLQDTIGDEVRKAFTFPRIESGKNKEILDIIENVESVSIHARRSDFLQYNSDCYRFGYFKKCVSFIKRKVKDPVWFIFSEDSEWCKGNLHVFGLDETEDKVYFIDWNKGEEAYRDMQLMSLCKHNITTKSSFGWWASYLNDNPNKITCSQVGEYITTHQF